MGGDDTASQTKSEARARWWCDWGGPLNFAAEAVSYCGPVTRRCRHVQCSQEKRCARSREKKLARRAPDGRQPAVATGRQGRGNVRVLDELLAGRAHGELSGDASGAGWSIGRGVLPDRPRLRGAEGCVLPAEC